ncbi:hypothetical protein ACQ4PT_040895 [Festuca glaucescens]
MAPGTANLVLKAACDACGKASGLYGTACRHATVCSSCGQAMARARTPCAVCAAPVTNLIREYNVRVDTTAEKAVWIGKFTTGLPPFSKNKIAGNHWSLRKDGPEGRQLTASMREKYYNRKPWILEDETGEHRYQSQLEASQSATPTYYLLMMHGKEFHAVPVGSWYNFSKIAQYKQLTLEEAEEKMKRRRSSTTGYGRWMMKLATHGPGTFGSDFKNLDEANDKVQSKKENTNKDGYHPDKGEEDEEARAPRRNAHGLSTKGVDDDEEEDEIEDFDFDAEIEIGDDWEHEEAFSDDDETPYVDPEVRPDLSDTENPAPQEIKQDDDEDEQGVGGLSKSGKELKKLLRHADGQSESDDDDQEDTDEDESPSPVLAPKLKDECKCEPQENNPAKLTTTGLAIYTPHAPSSNRKRRSVGDDSKTSNGAALKKPKNEPESKALGIKEQPVLNIFPLDGFDTNTSTVTEEEITRVLIAFAPVAMQDFVSRFKPRLRTPEDKKHFSEIVTKITRVGKTKGSSYIYLREAFATAGSDTNTSTVTEEEIRRVLIAIAPVAPQDFASRFNLRLRTPEDRQHFSEIVKKIAKVDKIKGSSYICLREAFASAGSDTNTSTVTEEEIRRVLIAIAPVAIQDFASRFRPRLRTPEDKQHFFEIVKKIAKLDKTKGISYICLREAFASAGSDTNTSTVTEEEIRRVLIAIAPVALLDFASRFYPRLRTPEDKQHFSEIVKKIAKVDRTKGSSYICLREEYK